MAWRLTRRISAGRQYIDFTQFAGDRPSTERGWWPSLQMIGRPRRESKRPRPGRCSQSAEHPPLGVLGPPRSIERAEVSVCGNQPVCGITSEFLLTRHGDDARLAARERPSSTASRKYRVVAGRPEI